MVITLVQTYVSLLITVFLAYNLDNIFLHLRLTRTLDLETTASKNEDIIMFRNIQSRSLISLCSTLTVIKPCVFKFQILSSLLHKKSVFENSTAYNSTCQEIKQRRCFSVKGFFVHFHSHGFCS